MDCKARSICDSTTQLVLHGDLKQAQCYVVNEVSSLLKRVKDLLEKYKLVMEPHWIKSEEYRVITASYFIDT